jgi:hypothetical protein
VNFDLIRSWLGLPPGDWPPDHYTLLGFAPGHSDAAAFEPRVLQHMERLRNHQLLQPELVTEGMNRLAQALITLTDPDAKSAYDSELKLPVQTHGGLTPPARLEPAPPVRQESVIIAEPFLEDELPEAEPYPEPSPTEVTQEIVLPAELIPPYEVLPDPPPPLELSDPLAVRTKPPTEERPAVRPWPTPQWSRRWIYTRLALIRRGRREWLKLKPVFLDPNEPLDRPARIVILLEAAGAVRPLLPALSGVVGGLDEPGMLVATVVKQPLLLDTIRRLLPDQRQALSTDWRTGLQRLEVEYDRLRAVAVEERAKAEGIPRTPVLIRWLRAVPELLLVAFAALILLLSVLRSLLTRSS